MHACHTIRESEKRIHTDEIDELVFTNAASGDDENARQDHREISSSHAQKENTPGKNQIERRFCEKNQKRV